jgi:hypothetical protein
MPPIIRDERGRFVPVVRPKLWQAASVTRSRDRTDRIGHARKQSKARLATTQWISELDRQGFIAWKRTASSGAPLNCGSRQWTRARAM